MEHYQNRSLEILQEIINNILCVEEWVDVHGYEGFYQVSSFGRVKRFKRKNCNNQHKYDSILKPKFNKKGYLSVSFHVNGKVKGFRINRLVGCMFIPNPDNKPEVNHKDGIKINNRKNNLEWNTGSENQLHSFRVLKRKVTAYWTGKGGKEFHSSKRVQCVETEQIFDTVNDAAKYVGLSRAIIWKVCTHPEKTIKGFHYKYL